MEFLFVPGWPRLNEMISNRLKKAFPRASEIKPVDYVRPSRLSFEVRAEDESEPGFITVVPEGTMSLIISISGPSNEVKDRFTYMSQSLPVFE